uniref:Uncharacterized protein n=1 Tax=Strix occidentalis caurina TaxID=311401 RepID=A0A8D0FKD4_STROC
IDRVTYGMRSKAKIAAFLSAEDHIKQNLKGVLHVDAGKLLCSICTVTLDLHRKAETLKESQSKGQMLPVLQVIHLDLVDAFAAANVSLEKADNENQGLFLTSLVGKKIPHGFVTSSKHISSSVHIQLYSVCRREG